MNLQTFSITAYFVSGAFLVATGMWFLSPEELGVSLSELLTQAVMSAGISGLFVDMLRFAAQAIWPQKRKPKFALRKVMNANLV